MHPWYAYNRCTKTTKPSKLKREQKYWKYGRSYNKRSILSNWFWRKKLSLGHLISFRNIQKFEGTTESSPWRLPIGLAHIYKGSNSSDNSRHAIIIIYTISHLARSFRRVGVGSRCRCLIWSCRFNMGHFLTQHRRRHADWMEVAAEHCFWSRRRSKCWRAFSLKRMTFCQVKLLSYNNGRRLFCTITTNIFTWHNLSIIKRHYNAVQFLQYYIMHCDDSGRTKIRP